MKCVLLLLLISFICFANARQIRYSRYNTEVIEDSVGNQNGTIISDNQTLYDDNEVEATVREIKLAPYPASGFRPSRAFPLPNEEATQNVESDNDAPLIDESVLATTTDTIDFETTTQGYQDNEITTIINAAADDLNEDDSEKVDNGEDELSEAEKPKAPYPPAGYQPKIPFILPTDNLFNNKQQRNEEESDITEVPTELSYNREGNAPYPAAGYRPSKAFLLPSEQLLLEDDNNNHPICGSSTNPLAPKPLEGEKEDPDSESINIDGQPKYTSQQRVIIEEEKKTNNSNHPACGSSTNPLAPIPLDGEPEDPDSEPINIEGQPKQRSEQQRAVIIPVRFSVHPLLLTRPLVYSATIPSVL